MKKKSLIFGILLLGVVFTASQVSSTYARYITTDSGAGIAQVAAWTAAFKDGDGTAKLSESFQLTLNQENNTSVVKGKIAPDAEVYGEVTVDLTGTEVDTDIFVTLDELTGIPTAGEDSKSDFSVKLYKVVGTTVTEVTKDSTSEKYIINETLNAGRTALTNQTFKIRVALVWTNVDDHSTSDTAIGTAHADITANITLTAQQHIAGNVAASDKDNSAPVS